LQVIKDRNVSNSLFKALSSYVVGSVLCISFMEYLKYGSNGKDTYLFIRVWRSWSW
jgi:hypothetical protein